MAGFLPGVKANEARESAELSATTTRSTLTIGNLLGAVTAIAAVVVAIVQVSTDGGEPWATPVLVALVAVVVVGVLWNPAASQVRAYRQERRLTRAADRHLAEFLGVARQLDRQMELTNDNLGTALSSASTRPMGQYQLPAPNALHGTLTALIRTMERVDGGPMDAVNAMTAFDYLFSAYHLYHIRIPGEAVYGYRNEAEPSSLGQIRRTWGRYQKLVEDHRNVADEANAALGLELGRWTVHMPTPP